MKKAKVSRKVAPKALFRVILFFSTLIAFVNGKEPVLTRERYNRAVAVIRCDFRKAVNELGYAITPLDESIKETLTWLENEKILTGEAG